MQNLKNVALFAICIFFTLALHAIPFSDNKKKIYSFSIEEEIAPPATRKTEKALKEAKEKQSDIIILTINTFGGTLDDADKIRTIILESEIPVWAFINHNAASAGALISIACDSIYMHSGSSIGAATVVNQSGEVQPDKYQSYMRSMMRSTAESTGRDPDIAQAMVDPSIYISGISDSGKVLSFTTSEAIKYNYCQGQAENIQEVLKKAGIKDYEMTKQRFTIIEKIVHFLMSPIVSGILIMVIVLGLYIEFQTPGIGLPLLAAIIGAVLYFAPLYLEGLAANWEIIIFIIGLGLLALEIFVIPGFGVAGISGIILIVTGLVLSLVGNIGFDFSLVPMTEFLTRFSIVIFSIFISVLIGIYLSKQILTHNTFGHLALSTVQNASEGYTVARSEEKNLIGETGITLTILRPSGKVKINDNVYDAVSLTSYIEKGETVEVVNYENTNLVVRKKVEN